MPTALDRYFKISERGSSLPREIRGGFATFFAMAYIIALNPIILGSAKDMYGHQLDNGQLATATAVTAAFTTLLIRGAAPGGRPGQGGPGRAVRRLGGLRLLLPDAGAGADVILGVT